MLLRYIYHWLFSCSRGDTTIRRILSQTFRWDTKVRELLLLYIWKIDDTRSLVILYSHSTFPTIKQALWEELVSWEEKNQYQINWLWVLCRSHFTENTIVNVSKIIYHEIIRPLSAPPPFDIRRGTPELQFQCLSFFPHGREFSPRLWQTLGSW